MKFGMLPPPSGSEYGLCVIEFAFHVALQGGDYGRGNTQN